MADKQDRPRLHVTFYTDPVQNMRRSKEEGRAIFDDKEFVRIRIPGDRNRTLEAPANQASIRHPEDNTKWLTYIDRFPDHYAAFKKGQTYVGSGTPLAELPFLTEAKRAELRAINIFDAESLAALDGTPLKQLGMGGREWKDQAQAWLDKAKGSAVETRLAADNAALRDQMETMQRQLAEMMAGKASAPAPVVPVSTSPFASWAPEAIKAWIAEKTGSRPRGNPSLSTLISTADEISAQTASKVAA